MEQTPIQQNNSIPPTLPPMPPTPPMFPAKRRGSGSLIKIIIAVVALSAIAAGSLLAEKIWDPYWNPFRPNPQTVLDAAFNKIKDWKTNTSDLKINIGAKMPANNLEISISLEAQGNIDASDPNNLKGSSTVDLSTNYLPLSLKLGVVSLGSSTNYVNLENLSIPPQYSTLLSSIGFDPNIILNQWIKIDVADIQKLVSQYASGAGVNVATELQLSQIKDQIQQVLLTANLNNVKNQLPDAVINGQNTYHYLVAINRDGLKNAINQFFAMVVQLSLPGSVMPQGFNETTSKFIDAVGEINYEVWIGQNDGELYKIKLAKSIDISKFDATQTGSVSFGFESTYSNINQPVEITAPEGSKTIQELFPQFFKTTGKKTK